MPVQSQDTEYEAVLRRCIQARVTTQGELEAAAIDKHVASHPTDRKIYERVCRRAFLETQSVVDAIWVTLRDERARAGVPYRVAHMYFRRLSDVARLYFGQRPGGMMSAPIIPGTLDEHARCLGPEHWQQLLPGIDLLFEQENRFLFIISFDNVNYTEIVVRQASDHPRNPIYQCNLCSSPGASTWCTDCGIRVFCDSKCRENDFVHRRECKRLVQQAHCATCGVVADGKTAAAASTGAVQLFPCTRCHKPLYCSDRCQDWAQNEHAQACDMAIVDKPPTMADPDNPPPRPVSIKEQKYAKCSECGTLERDAKLRLCLGCRSACYCSTNCQTRAWSRHKTPCREQAQHAKELRQDWWNRFDPIWNE